MPVEPHDVFLSYARADNAAGRITAFAARLKRDYFASVQRELRIYLDIHEIKGMDQWRDNILWHLQQSHVLLACLSPNYLKSDYCQWEFTEYLKGEIGQNLYAAGIAPVYAFTISGWDRNDPERAEWIQLLRWRQAFDLRAEFESPDPHHEPAPGDALIGRLAARIRQAEQSAASPGFLDPHNQFFTGRAEEMDRLRNRLVSPASATGFTILHGLGGIGKTSLAVEYAHNFAHEYPAGRWQAKCGGAADLNEALIRLASRLGIDFHPQEPADSAYRAERVVAELQRRALEASEERPNEAREPRERRPRRCLLILDNIDAPELLSASQTRILPREKWLHVVVTSQLGPADLPDLAPDAFLPVDRLSDEEALRLLERQQSNGTFQNPAERELARQVVSELGGFTLAVEAAAVFLAQFPEAGCTTLLEEIASEGLKGLEEAAVRTERGLFLHDEKRLTVTLRPILDRLKADEWLALEFASLMPPDTVIWEWIESLVGDKFPAVEMAEGWGEIGRWTAIIERLQSLRLVTPSPESWAGRIHNLVREVVWMQDGFGGDSLHKQLIEYAFHRCAAMEHDWDERAGEWELEALRRWAVHLMTEDELGGGALESRIAELLRKQGRFREEEPLRRHVLKVRERLLGHDSGETASATYDLGVNLVRVGQFAEAAALFQRSLLYGELHLGELDRFSLACLNGLGSALESLGDLRGAEPLLRKALEGRKRVLGPEHPNTLASMNNLAELYESQGRYAEAEPLYQRGLRDSERVLGPEHPQTLGSVNNLARLYQGQGRYAEAELLFHRALCASERVLGPEHPQTLASVNNLAALYESQGRYAAAEPLYHRALRGQERVLGPEHPATLSSANNLAGLYRSQGRYAEAEPFYERALRDRERVLGPEHPATLVSVNNLALLHSSQGRYAEAEPFYERALRDRERVLGPEHPDTLVSVNNLATLYYRRGRYAEAELLFQRAARDSERVLGPKHPQTAMFRQNLTALLAKAKPPL